MGNEMIRELLEVNQALGHACGCHGQTIGCIGIGKDSPTGIDTDIQQLQVKLHDELVARWSMQSGDYLAGQLIRSLGQMYSSEHCWESPEERGISYAVSTERFR